MRYIGLGLLLLGLATAVLYATAEVPVGGVGPDGSLVVPVAATVLVVVGGLLLVFGSGGAYMGRARTPAGRVGGGDVAKMRAPPARTVGPTSPAVAVMPG